MNYLYMACKARACTNIAAYPLSQAHSMQYEYTTTSPLLETLNARDNQLKRRLVQKISTLNDAILDRLQHQPTFSDFVQHAFGEAFATLPKPVDLNAFFIKVDADTASASETLAGTHATQALLPTLMDAVAARIASKTAVTYANRSVSFYSVQASGYEPVPLASMTAVAFGEFLNKLADNLSAQFRTYLNHYWNGLISTTDTRTCRQWLAEQRIEIMKAEVELLSADGVLDASSQMLLTQVERYPDALSRNALRANRPCAYGVAVKDKLSSDIPLYGAFILTSRDQDDTRAWPEGERPGPSVREVTPQTNVGNVLLFLPASGFEAFDSLASLDRELHRRLNSATQFTEILDLMEEKDQSTGLAFHQQPATGERFRYVEKLESIFSFGLDSLYERVHTHFVWTVAQYQRQNEELDSSHLPASLDRVTDLTRVLDNSGVLTARLRKQAQLQLKRFLMDATTSDKQEWEAAVRNYSDELLRVSSPDGLPSLSQYSDRSTLLAYAREQLQQALETEHGLKVDPDDILVNTQHYVTRQTGSYITGGKPHPSEPGARVFDSRTRTLTELALENVEWLDLNFINFTTLTNKDKTAWTALSATQVKDLVRRLNIGDTYEKFLKARLVTSESAQAEQQRYAQIMALQIRVDALEAKIAKDFLPDRLDRGFQWVMSVLAGPQDDDTRPHVEQQRIIVSSLRLRGERVRGVLVFSTASQGVASMVVYTSRAQGGRSFHEYADASTMHRDFINHSAWRDYLVSRTALGARPRIRSLLSGKASAADIALTRIDDNFLEDAYKVEASSVINEANAHVTSTQEANFQSISTLTTVALDLAAVFMPVKVMVPIGLARSMLSVIDAVEAAHVGDRVTAAHATVRAFGELVGAVIDGAVSGASPRPASTPRPTTRGLDPRLALPHKPEGLSLLTGWETHHIYVRDVTEPGTFQAPRHFLLDNHRWYSIRRDNDALVWRLNDPRRAPSAYKGDPIHRNRLGVWEIRSPGAGGNGLALLGGSPLTAAAENALMDLFPYLDRHQARQVFAAFVFPRGVNLNCRCR